MVRNPIMPILAFSYVTLFDATGRSLWLRRAEQLTKEMDRLFSDRDAGDYIKAKTDDPVTTS